MKEKHYNRENRAGGERGREKGTVGFWKVGEEKRPVCQTEERWRGKTEYDYMKHEWYKMKMSARDEGVELKPKEVRKQQEDKRQRDGGWRSHSHVEDGLLVSHHLAVSHCQGVVASLQVKILKCQLDHLENSRDITKTTMNDRCLNVCYTTCRGGNPSHLSQCIPLSIHQSFINLFWTFIWHRSIHMYATAVYVVCESSHFYCY